MLEPSLLEAFKHSPLFFLLGSAAAVAGLVLAVVGAIMVRGGAGGAALVGGLALALGLCAMATGVTGWLLGRSSTDAALAAPGLTAADRARLREHGYAESSYSLVYGLAVGALPLVGGVAVVGGAARRRRRQAGGAPAS